MQLEIRQEQKLSQQQLRSLQLLQMNRVELATYLNSLSEENPTIDMDPANEEEALPEAGRELYERLLWLEAEGNPVRGSTSGEEEFLSPLDSVGTDGGLWETLPLFLQRQIADLPLEQQEREKLVYLSYCLNDDGYMEFSDRELAESLQVTEEQAVAYMDRLRALEPAGVGARNLAECLLLQLERFHDDGLTARIVRESLEDLGRGRFRQIAQSFGVSVEEVRGALARIRQLDPRPGRQFCREERPVHLRPDISVIRQNGVYLCDESRFHQPGFHINAYYRELYRSTDDPQVKKYLEEKLRQADQVYRAVQLRRSTLLRCADYIVERQQDFFRLGKRGLRALRMADAAQALGVHTSTVSRAMRGKYIQCTWGIYPMSYFFSGHSVTADSATPAEVARTLLKSLVEQEDKAHPLSDEELCGRMKQQGCQLSRRTVAKYRSELHIPSYLERMRQEKE